MMHEIELARQAKQTLIGRFHDWLRERRISRLRLALVRAREGRRVNAWKALQAEIRQRSPAQIERMERDKGLA